VRAMAALKAMTAPVVRVRPGGGIQELPAAELMPGDLVLLGPGDLVAADLRLTDSWALRINEAALTGESTPITKQVEPLPEIDDSLLADRRTWRSGARPSPAAAASGWWSPPGWRPSWDGWPSCRSVIPPSRRRCSGGVLTGRAGPPGRGRDGRAGRPHPRVRRTSPEQKLRLGRRLEGPGCGGGHDRRRCQRRVARPGRRPSRSSPAGCGSTPCGWG
jgi:hypothetical protein